MRLLLFLAVSAAFAQTTPKAKPEDYPVQAHAMVQGKHVDVGAEFMVHSFSQGEESYIAPDFLVVEVALYPAADDALKVDRSEFKLRINGKKQSLEAQPPQLVASSLTHPEWQNRPRMEGGGGLGGIGVGIGRPRPVDIPGQPPQPGTRLPNPTPAPRDDNGVEREPRIKPEELVLRTAFPTGEFRKPTSGFLYFPYKGKIASLKSIELLYADCVVKLR
jgi:hypothetical protein